MDSARIQRCSRLLLWGAIVWLPCLGYWATRVRFGTPEVTAWLPGEDIARTTYRQFLDSFGDDQVLFVTWPGCTLGDPRLGRMTDRLTEITRSQPQLGITRVQDSKHMLEQWMEARPDQSMREAQDRLQGFAIGADGSCFIALDVDAAVGARRAELISTLRIAAQQFISITPSELILAGEPYQVFIIDQASRQTIERYVLPSSLLALFIAWICLRSFRQTILVFVLAGLGQLMGLALIAAFVGEMSAVLVVLPTLIFMLTLSGAVHLTNYYRDMGGTTSTDAGTRAFELGAKPCVLATLTTVFGFGSLLISQLQPVWQFGSLAALGLCLSTVLLLGLFPEVVNLFLSRRAATAASDTTGLHGGVYQWVTDLTARHASLISGLGVLLLLFSAAGLLRLKTSTEFEDMFPPSSPAIQSLRWMQAHLGPINSLEFVISFPKQAGISSTADDWAYTQFPNARPAHGDVAPIAGSPPVPSPSPDILEQAQLLASIHAALEGSESVSAVLSAATFLPSLETGAGTRQTIRRAVLRRTLSAHVIDLQNQHLLADRSGTRSWRISARIGDLSGNNYREVQSRLASVVQQQIDARFNVSPSPNRVNSESLGAYKPTFAITGLRTVIEKAHFALLSDLGQSFAMAFLLILPVMMLIARGIKAGFLLMLPNVLPVALVFGCMGWLSIKLDVASILTASVALGIAVDDTLHFVTWFLRARAQGLDSKPAVHQAFVGCARAMLHTSIICTASMLPFFFSDFIPTSKFALLMILILSGAIIGDLLLLPAILQSPLGQSIGQPKHPRSKVA